MTRSFRFKLAVRATLVVVVGIGALALVTLFTLKTLLDREIDSSILNIASIQAASLADGPGGSMEFHEWELTPDEAASVQDLVQYAQVWRADGVSLLRSRYMTSDLPVDTAALAAAAAGELVWTEGEYLGTPVRTLYYPLERLGMAHEAHVLQVAGPLTRRNQMLARAAWFFGVLVLLTAMGTFAGAWWLAGSAVRPIHEVIDQAEEIGARSLDRRIQAYADTVEYRRLVEVLNTMLSRLQGAFESQRRFTADASHELRSPLTAMRGEIEVALKRPRAPGEYVEVLESSLEETERLSRLSEDLLTLARSDSATLRPNPEHVDALDVVERVVERLGGRARQHAVTVKVTAQPPTDAVVDGGMLGQVVWNLLDNALKFSPAGSTVELRLLGDDDVLRLVVEDSGPGLGDIDEVSVWERFSRGDSARTNRGAGTSTGLGLAIVRALVEAHGGTVAAESRPEGGARFTVQVPRSTDAETE
ncbi:MAG: ATP-binding protein [Longimicrobiales bacterium]|nr:ATP-binding protein [Longimicrobiales bacterium]